MANIGRGAGAVVLGGLVMVVLTASPGRGQSTRQGPGAINSVETIVGDMTLEPDGQGHGIPSNYSWASGKAGVDAGGDPRKFRAATAWGQLYEAKEGNPATNTRVQLRNLKLYVLSKADKKWHLLQDARTFGGAAWREDFKNNEARGADIRKEADGGISVTAGGGYNFHFFPGPRASIDPVDLAGLFVTVQARLIVGDAQKPDDRATARYVLQMGGDWWIDLHTGWKPDWSASSGIGGGRMKRVTAEWQAFNMITLPEEKVRENPPPVE